MTRVLKNNTMSTLGKAATKMRAREFSRVLYDERGVNEENLGTTQTKETKAIKKIKKTKETKETKENQGKPRKTKENS